MKIHLLAALFLMLFFTTGIFAQSYPTSQYSYTSSQPSKYLYWPTTALHFDGSSDFDFSPYDTGQPESPSDDIAEAGYWVHYAEEDTATEQIYRRFTADSEPISKTPHVVALLNRGYAYDNKSGLTGSWTWDQDKNIVITLGSTKYVFRTNREGEGILVLIK